jgi:hypothetical protein
MGEACNSLRQKSLLPYKLITEKQLLSSNDSKVTNQMQKFMYS